MQQTHEEMEATLVGSRIHLPNPQLKERHKQKEAHLKAPEVNGSPLDLSETRTDRTGTWNPSGHGNIWKQRTPALLLKGKLLQPKVAEKEATGRSRQQASHTRLQHQRQPSAARAFSERRAARDSTRAWGRAVQREWSASQGGIPSSHQQT